MKQTTELFKIRRDVSCLKCGCQGAVQVYGDYYPQGVGALADNFPPYEMYRNNPYMSHSMGFGGTIPYECLNCGNIGLIDFGGLEGYTRAFKTIK